ncbi:hypothetical protein DSM14862_02751 [Sulfitobacter indolifex]|nr:hypothetical protein DSM14862_02751 [Sulfitobacter indolifex]
MVPPITASPGMVIPSFGLFAFVPFGEMHKLIPRTAFLMRLCDVSPSSSVSRSSDISATSISAHLGGAGSAIRACGVLLLLCPTAVCHLRTHSGFPANRHIRPTATVAPRAL